MQPTDGSRRLAARSAAQSLALRVAGLLATFLLGVLLARSLGPARYGVYGLVISTAALLASVCPLGTPQLAVREFAIRASRARWQGAEARLRLFQVATGAVWLGLCAIAGVLWLAVGGITRGAPVDWVVGAGMALALADISLVSAALRGAGALERGQVMETVGRPLGTLFLTLLLAVRGGVTVIAVLSAQLVVAVWGALLTRRWLAARLRVAAAADTGTSPDAGPWLGRALPLGIVDAIRQFDATYALLMMGWLATEGETGLFRVALACGAAANMAISIMHTVFAPRLSQLFDAGDLVPLQRLLTHVSLFMIAVSGATLAGLLLLGRWAVVLAFGPVFAGAWPPLVALGLGQLCFGLFGMGPIMLSMAGRERPLMVIYAMSALGGVACGVPLILAFGAIGAAAAQAVSLTLVGALSDAYARRRLGLRTSIIPALSR